MNNILIILILFSLLLPLTASAQSLAPTGFSDICSAERGFGACIQQLYLFSLGLAALIALFMLILAGYRYMTAAGNSDQVANAKEAFRDAFVGLIIIFVAFILLNLINPDLVTFKDFTETLNIPEIKLQEAVQAPGNATGGGSTTDPNDPFPNIPGGGGQTPVAHAHICATSITGEKVCGQNLENISVGSQYEIYSQSQDKANKSHDPDEGDTITCQIITQDPFLQKSLNSASVANQENCRNPDQGAYVLHSAVPTVALFSYNFFVTDGLLKSNTVTLAYQTVRETGAVYSGDSCEANAVSGPYQINQTYKSGTAVNLECVRINNGPWLWKWPPYDLHNEAAVAGCSSKIGQNSIVYYPNNIKPAQQCVPSAGGVQEWELKPLGGE